jgi:quercetin dioxygenase-like cupin family protein
MNSFYTFELDTACLADSCDTQFPTALHAWNETALELSGNGTHFGFVQSGKPVLRTGSGEFILSETMYFSVPGNFSIAGGAGIVVTRVDYQGLFSIGGKIETTGRLRYIDGCTDTLLIAPPVLGDPCLNALYFPKNIRQTPHTHPSVRVGIVASGAGTCVLPDKSVALQAGQAFVIAPDALHSFNTDADEMIVIAYHPDSDFGATDESHPMLNRTIIKGVSAANLAANQTL